VDKESGRLYRSLTWFFTTSQAHSFSLPLQRQVAFERWLRTGYSGEIAYWIAMKSWVSISPSYCLPPFPRPNRPLCYTLRAWQNKQLSQQRSEKWLDC